MRGGASTSAPATSSAPAPAEGAKITNIHALVAAAKAARAAEETAGSPEAMRRADEELLGWSANDGKDEGAENTFELRANSERLSALCSAIEEETRVSREKLRTTINLPIAGVGRAIDIFGELALNVTRRVGTFYDEEMDSARELLEQQGGGLQAQLKETRAHAFTALKEQRAKLKGEFDETLKARLDELREQLTSQHEQRLKEVSARVRRSERGRETHRQAAVPCPCTSPLASWLAILSSHYGLCTLVCCCCRRTTRRRRRRRCSSR